MRWITNLPWYRAALRRARVDLERAMDDAARVYDERLASRMQADNPDAIKVSIEDSDDIWVRAARDTQQWIRRLHYARSLDLPLPVLREVPDPPQPGTAGPACRACHLPMWVGQAHYCVTVSPLARPVTPAGNAIKES
jgi:hypothetical protein